jgi:ribosomal protein L35
MFVKVFFYTKQCQNSKHVRPPLSGSGLLAAVNSYAAAHKTTDRKNKLSKIALVDETDIDRVRGMLPYI